MSTPPAGPDTGPAQNFSAPPAYGTPYPTPPYGGPTAPPPPPERNGLSIAGFILAIFIAPIGFILSIVALIQASRRRQRGKGLAIAGIVISLVLMIGTGALIAAFAGNASTIADPGCTSGKSAILDNAQKIKDGDPESAKAAFQTTIDQLKAATAKAKHDNVRRTLQAVMDDYNKIYQDALSGTGPDQAIQDKLNADAKAFDGLCTLGGAK